MRPVLAAFLLAAWGGAASAEGYAIYDLGETADRAACMQKAAKVLETYNRQNGGQGMVDPVDWIVYGWDFGPGDNDVLLMCPIFRGDVTNPMLIVHGEGTDEERNHVADSIDSIWRAGQ